MNNGLLRIATDFLFSFLLYIMHHDNYTTKTIFVADIVLNFFCTKFVCLLSMMNGINLCIQFRELDTAQMRLIEQTRKNFKLFHVLNSIFLFHLQILTA